MENSGNQIYTCIRKNSLSLPLLFFFLIFIYLFIYCWLCWVFVAVRGLFSSCGNRGLLFVAVCGLLLAVASFVLEHRLQAPRLQQLWHVGSRTQAQQLWHKGLVAPRHVGSSRTRARTHVPCIGRQILNHCTTREVQSFPSEWGKTLFSTSCVFLSCVSPLHSHYYHSPHSQHF